MKLVNKSRDKKVRQTSEAIVLTWSSTQVTDRVTKIIPEEY